jgi:hypothetical protein
MNLLDGGLGALAAAIGNGDDAPFAREQQRHGATVPDRVGGGVERALPTAYDEQAPALKSTPARRLASRLGAVGSYVAWGVRHGPSQSGAPS